MPQLELDHYYWYSCFRNKSMVKKTITSSIFVVVNFFEKFCSYLWVVSKFKIAAIIFVLIIFIFLFNLYMYLL